MSALRRRPDENGTLAVLCMLALLTLLLAIATSCAPPQSPEWPGWSPPDSTRCRAGERCT